MFLATFDGSAPFGAAVCPSERNTFRLFLSITNPWPIGSWPFTPDDESFAALQIKIDETNS